MNKEIIQEFWSLPGVLGVVIIYGQTEPYFYVKPQILDWEKQGLMQLILQNITKTSQQYDSFEFTVMGYYAYTYRLNPQLNFIVLTRNNIAEIKLLAASSLKAKLQEDIKQALTTFELLTKNSPQSQAFANAKAAPSYETAYTYTAVKAKVTIEDFLKALNLLSQVSSSYMGKKLTISYLQTTRPSFDCLDNFQINQSAQITFDGVITEPVSALQHQLLKEWAAALMKQCSQIVKDFPVMLEKKGLDEQTKRLLFY